MLKSMNMNRQTETPAPSHSTLVQWCVELLLRCTLSLSLFLYMLDAAAPGVRGCPPPSKRVALFAAMVAPEPTLIDLELRWVPYQPKLARQRYGLGEYLDVTMDWSDGHRRRVTGGVDGLS